MKKTIKKLTALSLAMILLLTGCGGSSGGSGDGSYEPKDTINWTVTSSPGGGSDIYTRMIADIMKTEGIMEQTVVVTNKSDGGGEVGRNETANLKGKRAETTLMTFNSGDLMPMVENTKNRASDFRIIAIMAVDKQLLFKGEETKYDTFEEVIEAVNNGEKVVIGGSKGDDVASYEALIKELGVTKEQITYITYDSSGDAITAALGGHIEFVISKPAAASEYVEAKTLTPVLALSTERYGGNLADAPTLSEVGDYDDVEIPVWRGVVASKEMSDEAVTYWSEALKKVSETDKWKDEYLEKNKLIAAYMDAEEATAYITNYEQEYMEANGIN